MISGSERGVSLCEFGFLSVMRVTDHYERLADEISEDDGTVLPMQGGRSGGVQFDFARLKTKLLNLRFRQNSFEPERFTCKGATVEHLKPCLLVRAGNGCVQWPMVWPLNGDQPTHRTHIKITLTRMASSTLAGAAFRRRV